MFHLSKLKEESVNMKDIKAKHSLMGNDEFPEEELEEKLAIQFGKDAVALSGPCEGQKIYKCVTKQLEKEWNKHKEEYAKSDKNKLTRLATLLGESYMKKDDTDKAIQDIQNLGFDKTASSKIAGYLKAFVIDEAADKDLDEIKSKNDVEDKPNINPESDEPSYTDTSDSDSSEETSSPDLSDWNLSNDDSTEGEGSDVVPDSDIAPEMPMKTTEEEYVTLEIPKDVANEIAHAIIDSEKKNDEEVIELGDDVNPMPEKDGAPELEIEIIKDPIDEIPGEPKDEQKPGEQFVTNDSEDKPEDKPETPEIKDEAPSEEKPEEKSEEEKVAATNATKKTAADHTIKREKDLASAITPSIKTQGDAPIKAEEKPNFKDIGKVSSNGPIADAPKVPSENANLDTLGNIANVSASIEADAIIVTANGRKYRIKAKIASLSEESISRIASNIEQLPFDGNGKNFTLAAHKVFMEECESCKVKKTAADKKVECPKPVSENLDPKIKVQENSNPAKLEEVKESDYSSPAKSTLGSEETFKAETPTVPTAGGKDGGNVSTTSGQGAIVADNEQNRQVLAEKNEIQTKLNEALVKQERYKAASVYVADQLRHNEITETEFTKEIEKIASMPVQAIQALILSTKKSRERTANAYAGKTVQASNVLTIPLVTGVQSDKKTFTERLASAFSINRGMRNEDAIPDDPASKRK